MRKDSTLFATPLLGLLLLGLSASGLAGGLPDIVRFVMVVTAAAYLPGHILFTRYLRIATHNQLLNVALSFLLGLGAVSVFTWLCMVASLSFAAYFIVLQVTLALLFALTLWRDRVKGSDTGERIEYAHSIDGRGAQIFYGAIAALICVFFIVHPAPIDDRGDHYDHIGFIRAIALDDDLNPGGVLAPPAGEDMQPVKADPRKGTFHPFLAAACELGQLTPDVLWGYLPIVLAPLAFLLFLSFSGLLLPAGAYCFACVMLFLLFYGGLGPQHLSQSAYGQHLSTAYYWGLFAACMIYARVRRPAVLIAAMILFWGGSAIHISVLMEFLLLVSAFVLFPRIFAIAGRERLRLLIAAASIAAIVASWKIVTTYQPANMIHLHPQGLLYFTSALFVVDPVEILSRYGLVFLGGIILIPFLFLVRLHSRYAKLHLALAVIPLFLCFNPVVTPFVYDRGTYLVHRLAANIPALHITVLLMGVCAAWGKRSGVIKRSIAGLLILLWALLFIRPSLIAFKNELIRDRDAAVAASDTEEFEEILWFFRGKALEGTVILSDPVTSYRLSALTGAKVVAVLHQHGNPNDPYAFDRLKAVRDVLSPFTSQEEAVAAMDRYGANYLVCNGASRRPSQAFLSDWDPMLYEIIR
ncbi:MAG: hypothetical protein ABIA59_11800, partial [Candidatus Latescibacterota bacterium]